MPKNPRITTIYDADARRFHAETQRAEAAARRYGRTTKTGVVAANDAMNRSFRGAAQGIAVIDGPLGGISSRITAVNGLLTAGSLKWAALGVAVAAAAGGLTLAAREFAAVERQQLKTEALLRATGEAAGRTAEQLDAQARSIALATLASTEGIRQAQQVMLTFKSVTGETFDRTIVLAQDLAAVMGSDAKSAALQLGKALEDPATGLTALKRSGVSFTDAEKDLISTLYESGDVMEAQGIILDKLSEQVGGAGSGEAGGLSGKVDTLTQRWGEFLEALNSTTNASGIAGSALGALSYLFENINRGLNPSDADLAKKRLSDLHQQYVALGDEIEAINNNPLRWFDKDAKIERITAAREKLSAEMQSIQDEEVARQRVLSEKQRAAEEDAKRKAKEAADAKRAKEEEKEKEVEARRLERLNRENERIVSLQQAKFDRIHEAALQAQGRDEELENFRYENRQQKLQEEYDRMLERGLVTQEIEDQFRQARTDAETAHTAQIKSIRDQDFSDRMSAYGDLFDGLAGLSEAFGGRQSKAYRALFAASKAFAVAESIVKIQQGIASAASLPFPANIPAIGTVISQTAGIVSTIQGTNLKGVAHKGMTNIPREGTYLLDGGERVVQPEQNRDLTRFLEGGGAAPVINIHNYSGQPVEQRQNGNQIDIIVGRVKDDIRDDLNRGRGLANDIQQTYGLTRQSVV